MCGNNKKTFGYEYCSAACTIASKRSKDTHKELLIKQTVQNLTKKTTQIDQKLCLVCQKKPRTMGFQYCSRECGFIGKNAKESLKTHHLTN